MSHHCLPENSGSEKTTKRVRLWRTKGSSKDCRTYRAYLMGHAAKMHALILKEHAERKENIFFGDAQFGFEVQECALMQS
ncbi:hypothetical protein PoB_004254300 [Plakobranchus ocellatus]|uniref:Uncharacterized protein n=1 Tax=Plakobranchus ocellatus TaxID=259542 RepID=A0AAV4BA51_9GAST|nr:hypothetical protein PoB_004254300 [Plakobranchus ocellatus]